MNGDIKKYIDSLDIDRGEAILKLRETLLNNLPKGFKEQMNYNMPSFVVPHCIYPSGYHCDNTLPLPFISIASQKHFIAIYHMGIYSDKKLLEWFKNEYPKYLSTKLDMGKCCIRFRNINKIPFELIARLSQKMSVNRWVSLYEKERPTPK